MTPYDVTIGDQPGIAEVWIDCAAPDWTMTVRLHNESEMDVGFKAMTNSPRHWSVRPNGGVVEPHGLVDVQLTALAGSLEALASDRHLILSASLKPEEAARLRALRSKNVRSSLELLVPENPQVSQVRLTPRVHVPAALTPLAEEPCLLPETCVSACTSPAVYSESGASPGNPVTASAAVPGDSLPLSVAERVVELQKLACHNSSAAPLTGARRVSDHGPLCAEEVGSREREGDGARQWLVDLLFDEISPWFKWKVYDVLWALLLLLLARRFKCVRKAQELLDL